MSETATPKTDSTPKKGKSRMLIIAVGALVVVGGGGAAAFHLMRKPAEPEHASAPAKIADPGLVSLEPFTVNLADGGGSHFLRVNLKLVVDSPAEAEHVQKNEVLVMRVRSSILELLSRQKGDALVTPDGKTALKTAIGEQVNAVLEHTKVNDVLFSDFVVQF